MDINKASNEELVAEQKRLNDIFIKCRDKVADLMETMEKATVQYEQIRKILESRGYDDIDKQ